MNNRNVTSISGFNLWERTCFVCRLTIAAASLLVWSLEICWGQRITLRDAPAVTFPAETDSNSPAHWDNGILYVFNSFGSPMRSQGFDQFQLGEVIAPKVFTYPRPKFNSYNLQTRWIEATWQDSDGTLYAWYHHEPSGVCPNDALTAPQIGALRSTDNGASFVDLGIVLTALPVINCDAQNGFFAGGNGDFSVMFDSRTRYFYFFLSTYAGEVTDQGVAVARMAYAHRDHPRGRVYKYYNGRWREPGLGGFATPIFPAMADWMGPEADSFWGPSVHWNTYLRRFVMLLNRSCCSDGWPQEGIYASYNSDISNPQGWSTPKKFLEGAHEPNYIGGWYPQVLGLNDAALETDKVAGQVARFYLGGRSDWEIVFWKE
jgi:hypothetical protein